MTQPPRTERAHVTAAYGISKDAALCSRLDALKDLHIETAAELDALLPAVLDRALKGEL